MFGTVKDDAVHIDSIGFRVGTVQYIASSQAVGFRGDGVLASTDEECLQAMDESYLSYPKKSSCSKIPWNKLQARHLVILKDGRDQTMQCLFRRVLLTAEAKPPSECTIDDFPHDDAFCGRRLKLDIQRVLFAFLRPGYEGSDGEKEGLRSAFFEGLEPEDIEKIEEYVAHAEKVSWEYGKLSIHPATDGEPDDFSGWFRKRYTADHKSPCPRQAFDSAITPLPKAKPSKKKKPEEESDPLVDAPDHVYSRKVNGRMITTIFDLPSGSTPKATIIDDASIVLVIFPIPEAGAVEKRQIRQSELDELNEFISVEDTPAGMRNVTISMTDGDYKLNLYPCGYNHVVISHAPLTVKKRARAAEFQVEAIDEDADSVVSAPKAARLMAP